MALHLSVKKFIEHLDNPGSPSYEDFPAEGAYYACETFFVDDTAICLVTENVNHERTLLISATGLSPHITPFIPELISYSKVHPQNIYRIPQARYGGKMYHVFDRRGIYEIYNTTLKNINLNPMTVYNCRKFIQHYEDYMRLRENVMQDLPNEPSWLDTYEVCKRHIDIVNHTVTEFIKTHSLRECVDVAFFKGECEGLNVDENFRNLLRSALNSSGDLAFLKVIDGDVYTTDIGPDGKYRKIMDYEDAINLTGHLVDGTLKHGMKFGDFTIMSQKGGLVTISCNRYTPEMLLSVREDCLKQHEELTKNSD